MGCPRLVNYYMANRTRWTTNPTQQGQVGRLILPTGNNLVLLALSLSLLLVVGGKKEGKLRSAYIVQCSCWLGHTTVATESATPS